MALSASQYQRREHMTISAQVIDTIVESGLMTTCINRCVLMISLAMPGIRNGICNGCLQYKGEPGALYSRGSCCWPAICVTDQRVYDICPEVWLRFATDLYPASSPGPSICRRAPYRKENHSRALGAALRFSVQTPKTSDAHPAQHQMLNGAQC